MFTRSKSKTTKLKKGKVELEMIVSQNNDIDASDLDGEKVMMNLDKGQYFMLNPVAGRIWDIIQEPIKVKNIVETLLEEYEVEANVCEDKVIEFLTTLNNNDLIVIN